MVWMGWGGMAPANAAPPLPWLRHWLICIESGMRHHEIHTKVTFPLAIKQNLLFQVSYGSTSPVMSNMDRYPMFFRLVNSQYEENDPRIAFLKHFNWNKVTLVYHSEHVFTMVSITLCFWFYLINCHMCNVSDIKIGTNKLEVVIVVVVVVVIVVMVVMVVVAVVVVVCCNYY